MGAVKNMQIVFVTDGYCILGKYYLDKSDISL